MCSILFACNLYIFRISMCIICGYMHVHEKIRWTGAKRHTVDSCFELVGSHQRSPAQFTLDPQLFRACWLSSALSSTIYSSFELVGFHQRSPAQFTLDPQLFRACWLSSALSSTIYSSFELVGFHQRSPAQFTWGSTPVYIPKVFLSSCGSESIPTATK